MSTIGLYTATKNELDTVQYAASNVDADLVVRSGSDLADGADVDAFINDLNDAIAVVFWLHGAKESMPGYSHAVTRLNDAGVPLIVKSTDDVNGVEETTVPTEIRDQVYDYLDRGGTSNVANCLRFLIDEYGRESEYDDPVPPTPVIRSAGTYGELAELEKLADYYREVEMENGRNDDGEALERLIRETVADLDLAVELGIASEIDEIVDVHGSDKAGTMLAEGNEASVNELVERIHAYLADIKTTQIRLGPHTISEPPGDERLVEYLVTLTRLKNPSMPSLRESVAGALGVNYERMLNEPGTYDKSLGMTYAEAADAVYETSLDLVSTLSEEEFEVPASEDEATSDDETTINLLVVDMEPLGDARTAPGSYDALREVLAFICDEVASGVRGAADDVPRTADALTGEYVPLRGSDEPIQGNVDLLPMVKDFYALDPREVPSKSAWHVGQQVADGVVERHSDEHDEYPEEVGVVAWGTPTVRTRGETIAQVLALMGVEPDWTNAGQVDDVTPIPLDELDRPRIDVTARISGLFRDAFPQAASAVHDAVDAVVALDEPPEWNYVKKHVEEETEDLVADGLNKGDATSAAKHRVFTNRPGGYGAGTNKAINDGNWEDRSDLADIYVQWGGHTLGKEGTTTEAHEAFERRLRSVEVTVKLEDTVEQDEFDNSDWFAFHGGFITAVSELADEEPASYVGDSSDPNQVDVHINEKKVRKAMRARVLNPDWLDSMEAHDYKGAGDLSAMVDIVLGWDATTGVISDALWDDVAEKYVFDKDRRDWMCEVNPWAVNSITDTLLEASERGLWDADDAMVDRLHDVNLWVKGDLEAHTGRGGLSEVGEC